MTSKIWILICIASWMFGVLISAYLYGRKLKIQLNLLENSNKLNREMIEKFQLIISELNGKNMQLKDQNRELRRIHRIRIDERDELAKKNSEISSELLNLIKINLNLNLKINQLQNADKT